EVRPAQDHLWMFINGLQSYRFIILARDSENRSIARQGFKRFLKVRIRFADGIVTADSNVLPSHLTYNTSPKCVVEIDDDELFGVPPYRIQRGLQITCRRSKDFRIEWDLRQIPQLRVVRISARGREPGIRIENVNVRLP